MYPVLLHELHKKVTLSAEQEAAIVSQFVPKKLKKRQFLHQEGDVTQRMSFVEKGAVYSYSTDTHGAQHVVQFGFEGWWIGDLYSFFTQKPSRLNIEVLESCEVLTLTLESHELLLKTIPPYETYMRLLYQNAYVALLNRVENSLGLPAEEIYSRFMEQYPFIFSRVPLHLIASYMGITPVTLSRIRKQAAS
ncbi:cAMP-binding domain of CRP or a regulatory subunit of cAMP-dependent protein kinases [Dyadobacter soli]|uniref:cAMP-binding domain of CRP or a regulatory subunit of cAMP-dependent protein kinases n=1 Tax=Dyadobacter soli TaxID=659014 RepID=A0A1G8BJH0_9BACT|nr:Crp/Fnr family transcriptional regulator [Dyadobacter soli]SDH33214.1 cAMP-binding domain of CRP or a regulatory subunit of cAMP-dependent protein kinases [Dyadobacter soli]